MRLLPVTVGSAVATALLVAACGGGSPGAASGGGAAYQRVAAPVRVAKERHAVVSTRKGDLGTFLVDSRGRTLYLFEKDKSPRSTCYGQCAADWPPLMTGGRPAARKGAKGRLLSTAARHGGARQVVYHGHPLYRYEGDSKAGQTNGEGLDLFGAKWYVLAPSGVKIDED